LASWKWKKSNDHQAYIAPHLAGLFFDSTFALVTHANDFSYASECCFQAPLAAAHLRSDRCGDKCYQSTITFEKIYTGYNNYIIFRESFAHLIAGKDLYTVYSSEYFDLYKYSPSFCSADGSISVASRSSQAYYMEPAQCACFIMGHPLLPVEDKRRHVFILWFILFELITSSTQMTGNRLVST
jgi:hypothetical protein